MSEHPAVWIAVLWVMYGIALGILLLFVRTQDDEPDPDPNLTMVIGMLWPLSLPAIAIGLLVMAYRSRHEEPNRSERQ